MVPTSSHTIHAEPTPSFYPSDIYRTGIWKCSSNIITHPWLIVQGPNNHENHEHLSFWSWSTKCIFCSKGPATFDVRFIVLRSALTSYHHDMAPWSALNSWNANTNLLPLCDLCTQSSAWYLSFPFSRLTAEVYPDLHEHVTSIPPFFKFCVLLSTVNALPHLVLCTLNALHTALHVLECFVFCFHFCFVMQLFERLGSFLGGVVSFIVKTWNFLEVGVASCLC